ncbi:N-acetylmuramoyl-L-alanine amidase [Candidatus Pelagadaptatus aseana]|uniref:N-acetylmuramoyl-L-alanine amidase n=1 Tax=Candidatus Pelagadaptatus aseana TaxID=3120508 RepID=UPI003C6FC857
MGAFPKMHFRCSVLVTLVLIMVAGNALAASVKNVRLWRAPDNTRLVFDLSGPASHKIFTLGNPDRLVIDIAKADMQASLASMDLSETPIKRIRSAARNGTDLRVVLDLKQSVRPKSFSLKKHGDKLDRLVVDLFDQSRAVVKTVEQATTQSSAKLRDIVIAIDAGHGGEDPGALGPKMGKTRPLEKHVVLAISKELAKLIDGEPGYRAVLVRTGDYYIPLRKRRNIARENRADLFVSIHADAFKDKRAKGASVFALSRRGATSETARFLAQKENEADLIGGVGNVSLEDKDQVLAGVLVDLSMTATLSSSLDVGGRVLKSMDSIAKLHKPQVEQAGFAVLKSPDVPSILVETGFISNPDEAKKLSSSYYRKNMAKAIFKGVKGYFNQYPPAGSYVAWKKNGGGVREHVIARGDTLSGIAQRYNVSVNQLRSENSLSGSVIRVGQRLKIPAS